MKIRHCNEEKIKSHPGPSVPVFSNPWVVTSETYDQGGGGKQMHEQGGGETKSKSPDHLWGIEKRTKGDGGMYKGEIKKRTN